MNRRVTHGQFSAFADSSDFDTLRLWAVTRNAWQGPRMAAVIVSDEHRVWYVSPSGRAREVSYVRGNSGGPSQAEKLIARLEGRKTGPHPNDEFASSKRLQHRMIHVAKLRSQVF
jgi:hypothetical protein